MNYRKFFFIAFFVTLSFFASAVYAQITITTTVNSADGKPLALTDVRLFSMNNPRVPLQSIQAKSIGKTPASAVVTASEAGVYRLAVSAPGHSTYEFPLVLEKSDKTLQVLVTLAPYKGSSINNVQIVGDWNGYDFQQATPMKKQSNGTYTYETTANADTVGYQLLGVDGEQHSVNGTQSDYYVYDGAGDYRSVLKVKKGVTVKIVFDPKNLIRTKLKDLPQVAFDKAHGHLNTIVTLERRSNAEFFKAQTSFEAFTTKGGKREDFKFDFAPLRAAYLKEATNTKNHHALREFAAVMLVEPLPFMERDEKNIQLAREIVQPESVMWSVSRSAPSSVFGLADDAVLRDFLTKQPNRLVRARVLSNALAQASFRSKADKTKELLKELKEQYADIDEPEIKYVIKMASTEKAVAKGKAVPAFEVKLMDKDSVISNKTLAGGYYMMDFWAVWCGPCRGELPGLHAAYEKFKGKFTVLSLSFDRKPEDVGKFRAGQWTMPWLHTFVEKGFSSPLAQAFEVQGIPKPILVGPDGTVVATEGELRGDALEKTLTKFLGEK